MKDRHILLLINIVFFLLMIMLVFGIFRSYQAQRLQSVSVRIEQVPAVQEPASSRPKDMPHLPSGAQPTTLREVYAAYPQADVGQNVPAAWSRVSAADKAKMVEVLNTKIADTKAALVDNPADKKAQKLLFISESLKKMVQNNFDYTFESPPKSQNSVADQR